MRHMLIKVVGFIPGDLVVTDNLDMVIPPQLPFPRNFSLTKRSIKLHVVVDILHTSQNQMNCGYVEGVEMDNSEEEIS